MVSCVIMARIVLLVYLRFKLLTLCILTASCIPQALQRTLEFEDELAEKFGGGAQGKDSGTEIEEIGAGEKNAQNVSDIRKKYEKKLAAYQGSGAEVCCILTVVFLAEVFFLEDTWDGINHCIALWLSQCMCQS